MPGMPPVLHGVFDYYKITSIQIRDAISNHRQWVLLKVSPAGLVLCRSIQQKGWLRHLFSCSYCSTLGAESAAFHPESCTRSPALLQAQLLQIRGLGSCQQWGDHPQKRTFAEYCIKKGEQVPLCCITTKSPSLTLNLCLNGTTRSRLKPFLDKSLKCSKLDTSVWKHFSSGDHEHSHSQFISYFSLSLLASFEETY